MIAAKIIMPSELLRPYVHHYWIMRADRLCMDMNIMPMGCMKWMFHRGVPLSVNGVTDFSNVASVCGQYNEALHVGTNDSTNLLFVFFHPYAMRAVMGMPSDIFLGDNVAMDSLGTDEFRDLGRRVTSADTDEEAILLVERFILRQLAEHGDVLHLARMRAVFSEIMLNPQASLESLASIACLSDRQFRRVFSENVGMSPKHLMRIRRFLSASKMIRGLDADDFSPVIYRLGYTDHSHFNKEFRAIAGMSPSEYLAYVRNLEEQRLLRAYKSYHD